MEKFYKKTWFCILMLFLFCPVGIFLMLKYEKFNKTTRVIILTIIMYKLISKIYSSEVSFLVFLVSALASFFFCQWVGRIIKEKKDVVLEPIFFDNMKGDPEYKELKERYFEVMKSLGNMYTLLVKENFNIKCELKSVRSMIETADAWLDEIEIVLMIDSISKANNVADCLKEYEEKINNTMMNGIHYKQSRITIYGKNVSVVLKKIENYNDEIIESESNYRNQDINIDYMDGYKFETFCASVLEKRGYEDVEVTKGSGDQGVDIIAVRDSVRYAIQCKCYSNAVGNKAIQEVYTGKNFYNCQIGVVMTNNYFTKSAIELAKSNGTILWDRDSLNSFMKESGYCTSVEENTKTVLEEKEEEVLPVETGQNQEERTQEQSEIYPEGHYVVGTDIPLGKYIIKAKSSDYLGRIEMFDNYKSFKNNEHFMYHRFSGEFRLTLMENGEYLVVEDAMIEKL